FFNRLGKQFNTLDKSSPQYRDAIAGVSKEIREKVLKHVMVRRTRSDVVNYFKKDIEAQGLFFPEMQDPQKLVYGIEGKVEEVFNRTILQFREFGYARYIPLLYYKGTKRLTAFERQQQRNVGGFMKSLLVKRMESSFYAFKKSIARFVTSYERFIEMFEKGTVYISKKVNVYDLVENDDFEKLERLIEESKAHKYAAGDFETTYLPALKSDLEILRNLYEMWSTVEEDPKLEQLIRELKGHPELKRKRQVLFTESKETGEYLYERLQARFPGEVMFYCSEGGRVDGRAGRINRNRARDIIKENYDPNHGGRGGEIRVLISTDVLAEGVNLHRANILINYDLPWNPTRVLQRAGRINRLGTAHPTVNIFNFFPTSQADRHLGLERNITHKIQMFHDILGEDAKYLSDGEEIGSQQLFETLNSKKAYTGEEGESDSELKYLEMMRDIRDKQPDLFLKIRNLPKKARSAAENANEEGAGDQLITFFRLGKLKKFYRNQGGVPAEVTFFEAVKAMACEPGTLRERIPADYFSLLEANKEKFRSDTTEENVGMGGGIGGRSNLDYIRRRLKAKTIRLCKKFTESDLEFLEAVRQMLSQGTMAKNTARKIKKEIESTLDPLIVLNVLRNHIHYITLTETGYWMLVLKKWWAIRNYPFV
ncbi:MAG: helicase, partial [bacterium]|nr:helicase [bacterium]